MRFMKLKFIIPTLIVIFVGVLLGLYFVGGLTLSTYEHDNIEFNEEDFINFHTNQFDEEGNLIPDLEFEFDNNKLIAQNDDYLMIFDEETTLAKIVKKGSGVESDYSDYEVVFQTASDTHIDPETQTETTVTGAQASNLVLNYHKVSNGARVGGLNTMDNSVKFENTLTGQTEKYYKVNYIDNGVQILYEVGRFSANIDYFPEIFKAADFSAETIENFEGDKSAFRENLLTLEGRFRGNTVFNTVLADSEIDGERVKVMSYSGSGITYSEAAAQYLEENGLAMVTPGSAGTWWSFEVIDPNLYYSFGTHLNSENSPIYTNPYFSQQYWTMMTQYYNLITRSDIYDFNYHQRHLPGPSQQQSLFSMIYTNHQQMDVRERNIKVVDENLEPVMRGGFHQVDENGVFQYDEDGNPIQQLYSLEQVAADNAIFGIESVTSLERFQVGLQLLLTDEGLEATILGDSLKDYNAGSYDEDYKHDYQLTSIDILPEFTKTYDTNAEGMMVIPDGSGAVIELNNGKTMHSPYNKDYYGPEMAFVPKNQPQPMPPLMFGMYGYINNTENKGVLAVIEKGAAQSSVYADIPRAGSQRNTIYFTSRTRQREDVETGAGWNIATFPKWTKELYKGDLQYNFIFLEEDELHYTGLANRYRDYLMEKYDLEEKDTTDTNLVNLDFLGAFERYDLFLGIKYKKADSLTTFAQAQNIVDEMLANGVDNLSVGYTSWTKDEMEPKARNNIKPSPKLGGADAMKEFNDYLVGNGIGFYPELNIGTSQGYKFPFGNIKYTARGVGNAYAIHYPYNLATLMPDKQMIPTHYLSPAYYESLIERITPAYNKLEVNGAYVPDLGNMTLGSYRKKNEIYAHGGTIFQSQALSLAEENYQKLKLSAPFDYALPYASLVVDVPLEASQFGIFDYAIPFYQLVISGLFDYTTEYINGTSDKSIDWYFAKVLETGSNISFQLAYENPNILLDTDYTMFYKSYYTNWKDNIIDFNEKINETGIHRGILVKHETISRNVSRVTYEIPGEADLVLVVNASNQTYNYDGLAIAPYGYFKEGGE